jgi:hypothetical protein
MSENAAVDADALRAEVRSKYREAAIDPHGTYHFHTGRGLAARLDGADLNRRIREAATTAQSDQLGGRQVAWPIGHGGPHVPGQSRGSFAPLANATADTSLRMSAKHAEGVLKESLRRLSQ